ncbi:MAG: DUF1700 domain-containing protein [Terracidiphilus sp.]|nr:DUF1700 domain-containing protein [Terracidiphilus sp.]
MTAETQMESYLTELRLHLGSLTIAEREEIVREIVAHVRDSAEESGASVETVLVRLGPAKDLAAQYRDGLLIRRASRSNSPLVLLRGALRLATKGVFGILVFFVGLFGYAMGGGLVLTALVKPILPANTGVWFDGSGHFKSSGVLFPPPGSSAHEVLGMWFIPIALTVGSLLLLFTNWAIRTALRLSQRWQSRL